MLSLLLKSGDYVAIGKEIIVQVFDEGGAGVRVSVQAPREVPIVRGDVLERTAPRPDGVREKRPKGTSERTRQDKQLEKLNQRRAYFAEQERRTAEETAALIAQLQTLSQKIVGQSMVGNCGGIQKTVEQLQRGLCQLKEKQGVK